MTRTGRTSCRRGVRRSNGGQTLIYDDSLFPQPTAAEITLYE